MKKIIVSTFLISLILSNTFVYAAAVADRAQQQKQQQILALQQQQQYEQAAYQQVVEQQTAYQRAMQQRAMDQQRNAYSQALAQQQQAAQKQVTQQAYQQAVVQRASQQQQLAYQQAAKKKVYQQQQYQSQVYKSAVRDQILKTQAQEIRKAVVTKEVQNVAQNTKVSALNDIWQQLETSSKIWLEIVDNQPKIITIEKYVNYYASQGIIIKKAPTRYIQIIDELFARNPDQLNAPFKNVIRIVAIMEYDFNNGMNSDELARQVLGESFYKANRQRLGF